MSKAQLITASVETDFPLIERKDIHDPTFLWHYHRVLEIFVSLDGGGQFVIGDAVGEFRPREVFVVGPGVPHSFYMLPGPGRRKPIQIIVVSIMESHEAFVAFLRYARNQQWLKDAGYGFRISAQHSRATLAALQTLKNRQSPDELAGVITLLKTLAGSRRTRLSRIAATHLPEKEAGRVNKIYRYIHAHLSDHIQLHELAREAGMSVPTLCRIFKRASGRTVVYYVQECRIAQVCRQLVESERSVEEIACSSGFNSMPHFYRVFRSIKRMSPRELIALRK